MANLIYPASTGHYVDDKYSPLVEPNLFANNVFQPGVSYTDKYQLGNAGQIMVHKPGVGTVTATHPGADFSDAVVQDSLIPISLNKQFNRSRKMYAATLEAVSYDMAADELETALAEVSEGWQKEAFDALVLATGITVSGNILTETAADGSDIYAQIVSDRQKLVKGKAKPTTLIVTPETYSKLLKAPEFQRVGQLGDAAVHEGMVGRIAGMNVFEYEDATVANGATIGGITWVAANDAFEYVMYDHDAFAIVTSVDSIRVVAPTNFVGISAQVQIVSGFKLTNVSRALIKFHDASAA